MAQRNGDLYLPDSEALRRILELFEKVDPSSRERLLHTLQAFISFESRSQINVTYAYAGQRDAASAPQAYSVTAPSFSEDRAPSPKDFVLEKKPLTDIEKVACLAYYLSHYRSEENFKTLDISKLNTEAAQIKLSNAAQAVDNATKAGLVIPSVKGQKKISALGELYVQALPDRAAAKAAVAHGRPKRKRQKG